MGMSELWDDFTSVFTDLWDYAKADWRGFMGDLLGMLAILFVLYTWMLLGSVNNG